MVYLMFPLNSEWQWSQRQVVYFIIMAARNMFHLKISIKKLSLSPFVENQSPLNQLCTCNKTVDKTYFSYSETVISNPRLTWVLSYLIFKVLTPISQLKLIKNLWEQRLFFPIFGRSNRELIFKEECLVPRSDLFLSK